MAKVVFYCHDTRANIDLFEYYTQDLDALRTLGHEVVVCTRLRDIPWRFDLMFVWWWTHALAPVLLCRLLRRPMLTTGTFNLRFPPGFQGTDYFARPAWQRWLIAAATRLSRLNLFVNRMELEGCTQEFGLRSGRYYPHVVHDDYLAGPAEERELILFNLAWAGRQNLVRKGIPELIEAMGLLKGRLPGLRLWLAGKEGDGSEYLRELIARHGVADNVQCLGPLSREEKIHRLRRCEVYVQPSHFEGFGLAMAEALGCGACVITCDVGAVRDVVGDCGLYVATGSAHALAAAIEQACTDLALRSDLQRRAVLRARSQFATPAKIERLRIYLKELGIH